MAEQEGPAPRRALPPRDDAPDVDDVLDDEQEPGAPRRGMWSATSSEGGASAAEGGTGGTLIPPPAVLPVSDVAPASAGRRFSAVDLPTEEERPLPRRSALSPAATRTRSPGSPDSPADELPVTTEADADTTAPDAPADPATPSQRRGQMIAFVAAVVVVALIVAGVLLLNRPGGLGGPAGTPTPTIDPTATYLLQPDDLSGVREDTTWEVASTATKLDASTPAPKCLTPVPEMAAQPANAMVRTFSPTAGAAGGLLHQVAQYAGVEEATTAYTERVAQLGSCERNTAWVQEGKTITGLADESTGATIVLQGDQPEYHTIVVSRTGTRVNIVDATQAAEPPVVGALLPALGATFARQCTDSGTCPTESPEVAEGVPPAVEPFGFLVGVDLPRITAGAGEWRGTNVATTVSTPGSRCEGVDLTQVPGAGTQQQRTLLLQDDVAAPSGFGVDEVVYTFNTPEEAAGFVGSLGTNIASCADRTATAEVTPTADLTGAGTGAAWVITRQVDQAETRARYRVAALAAGNHAIYLLANPTPEFDFADEAFHGVALRASERLTQLP